MSPDAYRAALDEALREYERLTADRAVLDTRIGQLQQTIGMLTRLCGLSPTVPMGLTDACRLVLRGAKSPMTAIQVRERLEATGNEIVASTPEEFDAKFKADLAKFAKVVKDARIAAQD